MNYHGFLSITVALTVKRNVQLTRFPTVNNQQEGGWQGAVNPRNRKSIGKFKQKSEISSKLNCNLNNTLDMRNKKNSYLKKKSPKKAQKWSNYPPRRGVPEGYLCVLPLRYLCVTKSN